MTKRYIDTEMAPVDRGNNVICYNCGYNWNGHYFWLCRFKLGADKYRTLAAQRSKLIIGFQYSTGDMQESNVCEVLVSDIAIETSNIPDLSDWRTWANHNRQADECACGRGVKRMNCDYHKGA